MPLFNKDQKMVVTTILDAVHPDEGAIFFLNGPGGSGKTFVYGILFATICCDGVSIHSMC